MQKKYNNSRRSNFKKGGFKRRKSFGRNRFSKNQIDPNKYISKKVNSEKPSVEVYVGKNFDSFDLSNQLLKNLFRKDFFKTTEIQEKTITKIQEGKDMLGISATGSGKTGAFLIPLIDKIFKSRDQKILIITPTRELAQQILKEGISLVQNSGIRLTMVIGGESMGKQIGSLRRRPEIVVGTPGRLRDLYDRKIINFGTFNNVVIDEVDRMLDMGFVDDIKDIYNNTHENKQSLFFSATMNDKIRGIIRDLSSDHEFVKLANNVPTDSVFQDVLYYDKKEEKIDMLCDLLTKDDVMKTLVFVDTKRFADEVGKTLSTKGLNSGVKHDDKRQSQRKRVLDMYRKSKVKVLVATNVAARGIDINDISHVINLDEPDNYEEYIHRIGRTGRNGRTGVAYTFVKKNKQQDRPNQRYRRR